MQVLIIYALRNRIESGPVRCYYGDWIVVYRGREIARWQADFGRESLEFGRDHFTIDTGNYVITVDPKKYRIFDRAAGKPLVNGVVRIDEQDMKDILAAAPKSQRGWIRTRLGYMVVL